MRAYRLVVLVMLLVLVVRASRAQDSQRNVAPSGPPTGQPYGPPLPPEQAAPSPPKVLEITAVVERSERMTTKVAFVVDASGSMAGLDRIGVALGFSRSVLGSEGDELEVAIYAFKDGATRWEGFPHDGNGRPPTPGWTFFPSAQAYESATDWLRGLGAGGGTDPRAAVHSALKEAIDDLTVIIITDGEFNGDQFKQAVEDGQKARVAAGRGQAIIIVIGVGPSASKQQHLKDVGTSGLGGFFTVSEVEVETIPDEPPPDAPSGN